MSDLGCPSTPVWQTAVGSQVSAEQAETSSHPNAALPPTGDIPNMHSHLDWERQTGRCRVSKCPDIYWESLILVLIQSPKVWFGSSSEQVSASCFCRWSPNLVGPFEDTDGWVNGTPSVVVGARVLGYADSAVALVVWLAGAADLWPLCRALGVDITVTPWAKTWAGMKRW